MSYKYFDSYDEFEKWQAAHDSITIVNNFSGTGEYLVLERVSQGYYCNPRVYANYIDAEDEAVYSSNRWSTTTILVKL